MLAHKSIIEETITEQQTVITKGLTFSLFVLGYGLSLALTFELIVFYFPKLNGFYPLL